MWTDKFPEKALEYGGDCKVMMIFDNKQTQPSYQEVPSDTPASVLSALQEKYPTVEASKDGSRLWLSRLPEGDKRLTSGYEIEHGRWISGDPFEALVCLLVLGRNLCELRNAVLDSIAACSAPRWK